MYALVKYSYLVIYSFVVSDVLLLLLFSGFLNSRLQKSRKIYASKISDLDLENFYEAKILSTIVSTTISCVVLVLRASC